MTYEKVGDDILISQPDTIKKLEKDFRPEVTSMKDFVSPAGAGEHVVRNKDGEAIEHEQQKKYRSGAGIRLWLMKHSHPDICNSTREASKVMDLATMADYKYLLRIIKYILLTKKPKAPFRKTTT